MSKLVKKKIDLSFAIERAKFKPPIITNISEKELLEYVTPILRKRLSETKYDRVVIAEQFLRHFEKSKNIDPEITSLESFQTFKIDNELENMGNSCVSLSIDLINLLPKDIKAFNTAAILSDVYQQYAGPIYCHVTPLIIFNDPRTNEKGYVLLDPSFHISDPIVVKENYEPFVFDMGSSKKGAWNFYKYNNFIHCQPRERKNEEKWDENRLKKSLMVYRTDEIINPVESSSNPMFIIDRNYPIVSRFEDGAQRAHINISLDKKCVIFKIGKKDKQTIRFDEVINGYKFNNELSDGLLLDNYKMNCSIFNIIINLKVFNDLYFSYLEYLREENSFRKLLKYPNLTC